MNSSDQKYIWQQRRADSLINNMKINVCSVKNLMIKNMDVKKLILNSTSLAFTFTLQTNDMKKYNSFKTIKPSNPIISPKNNHLQYPTHSVSYRKLTTIDLTNQRSYENSEISPLSVKYSNLTSTNLSRKKMFSSKNQDHSLRTQTISKQNTQDNSMSIGYGNIRSKINDLQTRLNQIKRNYDQSVQSKKPSQKDITYRLNKQNQKSTSKLVKNKQNQPPKQTKMQSKLLLQKYQTNKKLKSGQNASTINLNLNLNSYHNQNQQTDLVKMPLTMKNINSGVTARKSQILTINSGNILQENYPYNKNKGQKDKDQAQRNQSFGLSNSPKSQSSDLKDFVTTFPCQNKVGISHSTSQSNLYKAQNKLNTNNVASCKNLYYVSTILNAFESKCLTSFQSLSRNHLTTSLDILTYIKNAKKQPPTSFSCKPLPPVKDNKHTIIFDLDETLIHCNENLQIAYDVALPIKFPNGAVLKAGINIRPYARECLRELSRYFELIVFTASHECYGNVIVDYLDPNKDLIAHRYFRDSCFKTEEGFYVKDLRVIDRDLRKVLLVDNAAYSYCFQLQNGVPVIPFYDNKADLELKNLISYLKGFLNIGDVRVKNENQMRLTQYTKFKDIKTLITTLYGE